VIRTVQQKNHGEEDMVYYRWGIMEKNSLMRGAILLLLLFSVITHSAMSESSGENLSIDVATGQTQALPAGPDYSDDGNESTTSQQPGSVVVSAVPSPGNVPGIYTPLTALPTNADTVSPHISGDYVVWTDTVDQNKDLFLYRLSTGTEIDLTPDWQCQKSGNLNPNQESPAIDGNSIVWEDTRNFTSDIFLFNIISGDETMVTEDTDDSNQMSPDISGNRIVWADDRTKGFDENYGAFTFDIYLSLIPHEEEILLSPNMPYLSLENPHISGNYVVCEGLDLLTGTYDIYLCTLEGGLENVVWSNLTPDTPYTDQKNPDISGEYVVWDGVDELTNKHDVFLYHIPSGVTTLLSDDTPESDQQDPSIHEDKVVWEDTRLNTDVHDIVVYDIPSHSLLFLAPTINIDQVSPDIYKNRVVWQGQSAVGEYDVCLFTIGIDKPALHADFSANVTAGESPLNVAFTDTSTGEREFWDWDFGDGNRSDKQNPVHFYEIPGTYTVALSTGNPYQRDVERKEAFISAGAEPVCRFSAGPVSGLSPLPVHFFDVSSGDPETWHWDFGDGNTSDEKNPVNIYDSQGTYNVSLTVANSYGTSFLIKNKMIMVVNATESAMFFNSTGISIEQNGNEQILNLDLNEAPSYVLTEMGQKLIIYPPAPSKISELEFQADNEGFSENTNTVRGTVSSVCIKSPNIAHYPTDPVHGSIGIFRYTVCPEHYPLQETLHSQIWEGVFPDDKQTFAKALVNYDYGTINDIAYTITFDGIEQEGDCTITVGVDAAWVQRYGEGDNGSVTIETSPPGAKIFIDSVYVGITNATITGLDPGEHRLMIDLKGYTVREDTFKVRNERDSIKILRIGDDGSAEVLNTTFLYHDPVQNLDYFQADSPGGMSKFSVSALGGPDNLFKLFYLVIAQRVTPQTGGGSGSGSVGALAQTPTPVTTLTQGQPLTTLPTITQKASESQTTPKPTSTGPLPTTGVPTVTPTGKHELEPNPMVLLKNLSVVFVVVLVTLVFYLRWNKRER
jgi:beta propeller repeat protein